MRGKKGIQISEKVEMKRLLDGESLKWIKRKKDFKIKKQKVKHGNVEK